MVHRRKRIAWLLVEANAAGVDSVQAQGMVGCRPGIVGVDGDGDGCMALEGTALESKTAKTHEAPVKLLRIR